MTLEREEVERIFFVYLNKFIQFIDRKGYFIKRDTFKKLCNSLAILEIVKI